MSVSGQFLMLKADDEVVGVPHDDHVARGFTPSPACGPEIEYVVQASRLAEFGGGGMSFNICRGTLGSGRWMRFTGKLRFRADLCLQRRSMLSCP
jgi:hypothetical protein